jgi:dGTPase
MSDDFYNAFDRECFFNTFNPVRRQDYRSVFQQDLSRILFTGAFRRLQAKTQVFQAGEYDFYRTRLTHSLDVSSVAQSIAIYLETRNSEILIDRHLIEGICLAHDIGHPPFGHAGERVLNELMGPHGGFEGNAQTLRILSRTIYSNPEQRGGMRPTRSLLDGVLKYKRLHRDRDGASNHFIYDDQAEILEFCFGSADVASLLGNVRVNSFRSLECQVMDLADDVSYSCFDIVDGYNARFLTPVRLQAWREQNNARLDEAKRAHLDALIAMMNEGKVEARMNRVIGELIQSASVQPAENFMTSRTRRHSFKVTIDPLAESRIELHKILARELVFGSSELQQMEFKGGRLLKQLGQTLLQNYLETKDRPSVLVPADVHREVMASASSSERARLICDYISGMTDAYALRSYKRLLDPDYGSISELI